MRISDWSSDVCSSDLLIDVEVNDKMEVRVQNDLPIATDVHWHGLKNDNANDGVAPYTQDLIEPGESFTYKVATVRPGVSMYHPHAHGHMLLPNGMFGGVLRPEERRVWKEGVSTCSSRWSPCH